MRSYTLPMMAIACMLGHVAPAAATAACPSSGVVTRLNIHGDGFLSVLAAPGDRPPYNEISRLHLGDQVSICDQRGIWLNVLFDESGRRGWVHQNYIQVKPVLSGRAPLDGAVLAQPAPTAVEPSRAEQYTFPGSKVAGENFCTVPQNAKVLLENVERSLRKLRPGLTEVDVVDAERLVPARAGATDKNYSCHGTFVLSNGLRIGATVSEHPNVAGEQITQVAIDPGM